MASIDVLDNLEINVIIAPEVDLSVVLPTLRALALATLTPSLAAGDPSPSGNYVSSSPSPSSSSVAQAIGIAAPSFKAVNNSTRLVQ